MVIFKWFIGINFFIIVLYILFLVINGIIIEREYKKTHFRCTYIKGMCTVKPTWKNCGGGVPMDYCEMKLNERL